jgi:hypothetical protein
MKNITINITNLIENNDYTFEIKQNSLSLNQI